MTTRLASNFGYRRTQDFTKHQIYPHIACDFIGLCSAILLCSTDSVSFLLDEKSPSTLTFYEKHLSTTTKHIHTRAQTPNSPTSPPSQHRLTQSKPSIHQKNKTIAARPTAPHPPPSSLPFEHFGHLTHPCNLQRKKRKGVWGLGLP